MFTVIIPAYNEAAVIERTLAHILSDDHLKNIEIYVVCNACEDNTLSIIKTFKRNNASTLALKDIQLNYFDTPTASKTNAVNIGISNAKYNQVVLVDADILISGKDIITLVNEMNATGVLVASPKVIFDYKNSHFVVQCYYEIAETSTYNRKLRISNVIALSDKGLKKLGVLPTIIADDDYIRNLFTLDEKLMTPKSSFTFVCPRDISCLVKALTRVKIGNIELDKRKLKKESTPIVPLFDDNEKSRSLLSFSIFLAIKTIVLIRTKTQLAFGRVPVWERDESSRK